jgi:excinuclease ABC subunit C
MKPNDLLNVTSPLEGEVGAEGAGRGGAPMPEEISTPLPIPPPQGGREEFVAREDDVSREEHAPLDERNEDDREDAPWPDLLLIDGGLGQLKAATDTLTELGITDVPMVSIAKGQDREAGRETFFMAGRSPFKLPPRDPLLYFVERLRDEAHRFAIGSHRARRKKDIREAGLQEIPGIGPTRKRALLRHFGTVKAIERASLPDLAQVPGINAETARKIYEFFHEQPGR